MSFRGHRPQMVLMLTLGIALSLASPVYALMIAVLDSAGFYTEAYGGNRVIINEAAATVEIINPPSTGWYLIYTTGTTINSISCNWYAGNKGSYAFEVYVAANLGGDSEGADYVGSVNLSSGAGHWDVNLACLHVTYGFGSVRAQGIGSITVDQGNISGSIMADGSPTQQTYSGIQGTIKASNGAITGPITSYSVIGIIQATGNITGTISSMDNISQIKSTGGSIGSTINASWNGGSGSLVGDPSGGVGLQAAGNFTGTLTSQLLRGTVTAGGGLTGGLNIPLNRTNTISAAGGYMEINYPTQSGSKPLRLLKYDGDSQLQGILQVARTGSHELVVGNTGYGTLYLGDSTNANQPGTIQEYDGSSATHVDMTIGKGSTGGAFEGWSTDTRYQTNKVSLTGTLTNNGKVTADGYGFDYQVLDLSSFAGVSNTIPNTDGYGWFATNTGKLILPALAITGGAPTYNWGEAVGDTDIDLVNSLRITPTALRGSGGNLEVALLARDREEPSGALGPMWRPGTLGCDCQVLGVWEFTSPTPPSPIPFSTADLIIRYDHSRFCAAAPTLVLGKATAETEWQWKVVDWCGATVDTAKHTFFKAGIAFPESGPMYMALAPGRAGDINLDGTCDVVDLLYLVDAFGTIEGDPAYDPAADFNCDAAVDVVDLLDLVYRFGCDSCVEVCVSSPLPGEESRMMGAGTSGEQQPAWHEALEQVGLLDVYMQYIAEHPEAARTW